MEENEGPIRGYKAHLVLVPYPAQGHINPVLQFSKRLASKGVKATLATTVHVAKSMHAVTDPTDHLVRVETISDGYDEGGYGAAESDRAYVTSLREVGSRTLGRLIERLAGLGHPVCGLVFDGTLAWGVDVAEQYGLVKVAFFTQSCAVSSVYYHVNKGVIGLPVTGPVMDLPGMPPLGRADLPTLVDEYPGPYPVFSDLMVGQFDKIDEADWVLHNMFYELEPQVVDWMAKKWRARAIGPLIPSMYLDKRLQHDRHYNINLFKPNTRTCTTWLDIKTPNSVVYVSFGSLAALSTTQMHEIAHALTQTNYNFLWVVREPEQTKLPPNFTSDDKGLVVSWCEQLEVLAHGAVGCFVTHCGFNSVLEAVSLGVAVVGVPQWVDQPVNMKFVEDVWGVGVRAWADEGGVLRSGELEMRIREVMEGDKGKIVKKNGRKWMGLAREAMAEGGSSDKNIDEFVASLVCS